jgi:ubiquinone/menaquinone biosynthesis C-methylase UbiE
MQNQKSKIQFNKQAQQFSNWSITKNLQYIQAYFTFCKITPDDTLLDVACGTGEFSIYTAKKIKLVTGVDISDKMIELAKKQAQEAQLDNINFICHDVENLPCKSSEYSIVICKSAFHHIENHKKIFGEMIRCCRNNGRLSVQDIIAYDNHHVNQYFEQLEKYIDASHHKAVSREYMIELYEKNNIKITGTFEIEIELDFNEYLGHAYQTEENKTHIKEHLQFGLNDPEIAAYFIKKNEHLHFKRNVFLILGDKQIKDTP